jgi:hypothetical protein
MKSSHRIVFLLAIGLLTGCSTVPDPYRPQALGARDDGWADRGLQIGILPTNDYAVKGRDILFNVTLTNVGAEDFLVPRDPDILFLWTYSNGRRDNFMVDTPSTVFYQPNEVYLLRPGKHYTFQVPVKTSYFPDLGVTEFRAVAQLPRNTNPELPQVWSGKSLSNAYGVMVSRSERKVGATKVASLQR